MPRLDPAVLQLPGAHHALLMSLLARHVGQAEVWAYGSRVTGGCHEGSDLDLVLRNPAALATPVTGAGALRQALQQSRLPMPVDTHQWCELPAQFQSRIEAGYVVLQAGSGAEP